MSSEYMVLAFLVPLVPAGASSEPIGEDSGTNRVCEGHVECVLFRSWTPPQMVSFPFGSPLKSQNRGTPKKNSIKRIFDKVVLVWFPWDSYGE